MTPMRTPLAAVALPERNSTDMRACGRSASVATRFHGMPEADAIRSAVQKQRKQSHTNSPVHVMKKRASVVG
jgi:hypothetical protein